MTLAESVGNTEQTHRSATAPQSTESEGAHTANEFIRLSEFGRRGKFEAQNAESTNKPRETVSLVMKLDVLSENMSETKVNELASKFRLFAFCCEHGFDG